MTGQQSEGASTGGPPAVGHPGIRSGQFVVLVLLLLRLPSLVQPAGGDQGLYAYEGQRILAGDVLYRDVWDQKPPGIGTVYAGLLAAWPRESVIPAADLATAALVALLCIQIGRNRYSALVGYAAAAAYLLLGDPYRLRLSGLFVRGQCEPFINAAVCVAVWLLSLRQRRARHVFGAGVALAVAFWLKYNAVSYGLVLATAIWAWAPETDRGVRRLSRDLAWAFLGFVAVASAVLAYFYVQGAVRELYLATISYNLQYSGETYQGTRSVFSYLVTFPLDRARLDLFWFVGGLGTVVLCVRAWGQPSTCVILSWLVASAGSIAINGSRDLPNYLVQANPPLAFATAAGFALFPQLHPYARKAVVALVLVALWRVGSDEPFLGMRLAGIPGYVENLRFDVARARGAIDRDTYLRRFSGKKHNALEIASLAEYLERTTRPEDRVLVFGFSGGSVLFTSGRASASRFFWSMPVMREFAANESGYGSRGLLNDVMRNPPVVVVLQHEEWHSSDFFLNSPPLRRWLEAGYRPVRDTPMFAVWVRTS